jgi:hypothetical protein
VVDLRDAGGRYASALDPVAEEAADLLARMIEAADDAGTVRLRWSDLCTLD